MIGQLRGTITHRDIDFIILDVQGVGYKIALSSETSAIIKGSGPHTLWTHLAVRENSLDLYGFSNERELHFFELLISISGIGPKGALSILSLESVDTLQNAISQNDPSYLTQVSGIGKKSAEKIVLELKDKMGTMVHDTILSEDKDVLDALHAMGYSMQEARSALKQLPKETADKTMNERLRAALQILGQ